MTAWVKRTKGGSTQANAHKYVQKKSFLIHKNWQYIVLYFMHNDQQLLLHVHVWKLQSLKDGKFAVTCLEPVMKSKGRNNHYYKSCT